MYADTIKSNYPRSRHQKGGWFYYFYRRQGRKSDAIVRSYHNSSVATRWICGEQSIFCTTRGV